MQRFRGSAIGASLLCQWLAACGAGSTFAKLGDTLHGGGSDTSNATSLNNTQKAQVDEISDFSAITGNQNTEVGLLFAHNPDGSVRDSCTGTLIRTTDHDAHNVVMTAKHCTDIDTFYVGNGQALPYPSDHDWQEATTHMVAYSVIDTVELDSGDVLQPVCPHPAVDIRLLRLAVNVTGVTPATIGSDAPSAGTMCNFVGFGVHVEQPSGEVVQMLKRSLTIPIAGIELSSLSQSDVSGGAPGIGDSGGPLYCGGYVVGTDSCGSGTVVYEQTDQSYARVDVKAAMIDSIVEQWAETTPAIPSTPAQTVTVQD